MPRDLDHLVETHRLADQRRRAGQPIWDRRINVGDIFHNDDLTFEQSRDRIAARIKGSTWYTAEGEDSELWALVDELADTEDTDEFDAVWNGIYDLADFHRVWIDTFQKPAGGSA